MPRVTYETYRNRHLILRQLWSERQGLFILISPMEQWALHEYYLCAEKATEESLLKYYQHIKSTQPSLPHRAGKAYAALDRRIMAGRPVQNKAPTGPQRKGQKALTVRSLVRPQPDMDLFVKTLISITERRTAEKAKAADLNAPT
jgi:hypothetical protein